MQSQEQGRSSAQGSGTGNMRSLVAKTLLGAAAGPLLTAPALAFNSLSGCDSIRPK